MAEIQRIREVRAGGWRTLESGWNTSFSCRFLNPPGAIVKVRYGGGIFGRDRQKQTLDGANPKSVNVGRSSLFFARVQMKVQRDVEVTYAFFPTGP